MAPFRVLRLLFVSLLAGCDFDPVGDRPMEAPPVYRDWWAKTEECSGRSGEFERVEWLVVPGRSFRCSSGECAGHWQPDHRIFIAEEWMYNEMVVRHEILHELLDRGGHPNPPFGDGCPLTWETWPGTPDATGGAAVAAPFRID